MTIYQNDGYAYVILVNPHFEDLPKTLNKKEQKADGNDKRIRHTKGIFYADADVSHTVASRELVRQVPVQKRQVRRFIL